MSSPEWCTWPIELCWPRYNEWLYNWIVASLSYGMAATDTRTRAVYSGAFQCVACPLFWLHATWGLFPWPLQLKIIAKSIYKITLFPSFLPACLCACHLSRLSTTDDVIGNFFLCHHQGRPQFPSRDLTIDRLDIKMHSIIIGIEKFYVVYKCSIQIKSGRRIRQRHHQEEQY